MSANDILMEEKLNLFMNRTEGFKDSLQAAIENKVRFNLNLDTLRSYDPELCDYIIKNPSKGISLFEKKLNQMKSELDDKLNLKAGMKTLGGFPVKS